MQFNLKADELIDFGNRGALDKECGGALTSIGPGKGQSLNGK